MSESAVVAISTSRISSKNILEIPAINVLACMFVHLERSSSYASKLVSGAPGVPEPGPGNSPASIITSLRSGTPNTTAPVKPFTESTGAEVGVTASQLEVALL